MPSKLYFPRLRGSGNKQAKGGDIIWHFSEASPRITCTSQGNGTPLGKKVDLLWVASHLGSGEWIQCVHWVLVSSDCWSSVLFVSVTKSTSSSAKNSLVLASVQKVQNVNWCTGQESLQPANESPPRRRNRAVRSYLNWILRTMKVSCHLHRAPQVCFQNWASNTRWNLIYRMELGGISSTGWNSNEVFGHIKLIKLSKSSIPFWRIIQVNYCM